MIILDTNVLSELMRPEPSPAVLAWFARHDTSIFQTTAIMEAELRTGIAILPAGKRYEQLQHALDAVIFEDFAGRILPFDSQAARAYAEIFATRRAVGHQISEADCQIASIARVHGASIATRNVRDFEGCGIDIVNPWND